MKIKVTTHLHTYTKIQPTYMTKPTQIEYYTCRRMIERSGYMGRPGSITDAVDSVCSNAANANVLGFTTT